LSDKQMNNEEFLRLFKESLVSSDPDRLFEIRNELRRLNDDYFPDSETLEVPVVA